MPSRTYDFSFDCPLPANQVFDALSDFSDRRVTYFPNLSRSTYLVIERGKTSALVREGTGPFRTQERYDWSTPGRIWSVVTESTVLAPGSRTDIRIEPLGQRNCRLSFHIERHFIGRLGNIIYAFVLLNGGKRFFRHMYIRALKNIRKAGRRR